MCVLFVFLCTWKYAHNVVTESLVVKSGSADFKISTPASEIGPLFQGIVNGIPLCDETENLEIIILYHLAV